MFLKRFQKESNILTLAANQNNQDAQYLIGVFYYENQCIKPDINKQIYYLTLLANQNNYFAQNFWDSYNIKGNILNKILVKQFIIGYYHLFKIIYLHILILTFYIDMENMINEILIKQFIT